MSRAEDLFSSSRVRALPSREKVIYETLTPSGRDQQTQDTNTLSHIDASLDGVVQGLADVHHGVEDDWVSGRLHLVSAGDKQSCVTFSPRFTKAFVLIYFLLSYYCFSEVLLYEDLHDGPADLHPHAVLLEHVQERQETLLENRDNAWNLQYD